MIERSDFDVKNLMHEAFRIEGITEPECRSIFMDWALSRADTPPVAAAISGLIAHYGPSHPQGHPMLNVLKQGQVPMSTPRRRGGARSRSRPE